MPGYKTAALPTELHRREDLCMVADTGPDMLFPAVTWAYAAAAETDPSSYGSLHVKWASGWHRP